MGFETCAGRDDVSLFHPKTHKTNQKGSRPTLKPPPYEDETYMSTYHVTVASEPTCQTVPSLGSVIFGAQTSLFDNCPELKTTGAADADIPRTKEKRSATGDVRSISSIQKGRKLAMRKGGT
jgi:hypothetical protein